jgi:general secretion pathway protein A
MLGAGVSLRIHPVPRGPIVNEDFFGLRENPFSLTPNPRYIHRTRHAHETLGRITRGILDRKGLILLTGDVGTGKTTLLYTALHLLDGNPAIQHKIKTAVIVHPTLTREEFLESILDEFDVHPSSQRRQVRLEALLKMLLDIRRKGGLAVLVIDEAQMLTAELLVEIRTLLELQSSPEKLLQVILCGHPAIEAKIDALNDGAPQQLEAVRCTAKPLTQDETRDYVQHRLRIAGARSDTIFLQESIQRVHERSAGIPRLVNLLCAQGLSVAASRQTTRVTPRMIEDAAARICAKAQARILEPAPREEEISDAEIARAVKSSASSASGVNIRTARRHKRAARRARIAEAARRASQLAAKAFAPPVRAAEKAKSTLAQLPASAQVQTAPVASTKVESSSASESVQTIVASAPVQSALVASAQLQTGASARVQTTSAVIPASAAKSVGKSAAKSVTKSAAKLAKEESRPARRFGTSLLDWNTRLNRWVSRNSASKPRGKRLLLIGLIGIMLLVVAEAIGELAPAHVVHIAVGFMGMLFIDIALGLGLYLLLISWGLVRTRPAWAQALVNSWSWLTRRS